MFRSTSRKGPVRKKHHAMREAPFSSFAVGRVGKSLIFPRFPQFVVARCGKGGKSSFAKVKVIIWSLASVFHNVHNGIESPVAA